MSENTDTSPSMKFDSSRAVVSTARATRLGFPRLGNKAVFFEGDTVVAVEYARTPEHATELIPAVARRLGKQTVGVAFVEAKVSNKALRGSYGRPKAYVAAKSKADKAKSASKSEKKAA